MLRPLLILVVQSKGPSVDPRRSEINIQPPKVQEDPSVIWSQCLMFLFQNVIKMLVCVVMFVSQSAAAFVSLQSLDWCFWIHLKKHSDLHYLTSFSGDAVGQPI